MAQKRAYTKIEDAARAELVQLVNEQRIAVHEAALWLGINYDAALKVVRKHKHTGITKADRPRGRHRVYSDQVRKDVRAYRTEHPFATLADIREHLSKTMTGQIPSFSSICRMLSMDEEDEKGEDASVLQMLQSKQ